MIGRAAALAVCLAAGAVASVLAGQDANWDLLNYHLYNGAALLQGRFEADLLAAGMQSYLNPVLDAAYAGLALGPLLAHPRVLAAAMGLWFGTAIFLAWRIAALVYPGRPWLSGSAAALAVTGTAVVVQVGTTTGELPVGVTMLAGLFVLLRWPGAWAAAGAGLLFGVAAGLKLTATAYAPAALLAVLSLRRPASMPRAGATFAAGWAAGLLAADGWWAWWLFERFGSPVFPMFNGVFRSPWFPPASLVDDRFLPRGWLQWLGYPLFWFGAGPFPGELPVHDPRAAIALVLGAAACVAWSVRRPAATPGLRAFLVFLAVGYAAWLGTSAILRYAVVLEVVAGLVVPGLLARVLPARAVAAASVGVLALALAVTRYPSWPRVPYGARSVWADMGWTEPGMLVVVTFRGPSAHVIAAMPQRAGVRVINVGNTVLEARGWPLHDAMVRLVREHAGPIAVVTEGHPQGRFPELGEVGLAETLTGCRPVASVYVPVSATGIHACAAAKAERPRLVSPFWAQAAARYRRLVQPADASRALVGAAYLEAAGPAARGTRFIDWTELLWSGVRGAGAPVPRRLDAGTLYVVAPEHVAALRALLGPGDAMGRVDGLVVVAPGWLGCAACTAALGPV